jgi:hypothetical protein
MLASAAERIKSSITLDPRGLTATSRTFGFAFATLALPLILTPSRAVGMSFALALAFTLALAFALALAFTLALAFALALAFTLSSTAAFTLISHVSPLLCLTVLVTHLLGIATRGRVLGPGLDLFLLASLAGLRGVD